MIRIALTGPESSGKTTLALQLSEALEASVSLEYARLYLDRIIRDYNQEDLDKICIGHREQWENEIEPDILVVDTDFIVLKIWSEVKYGNVSSTITDAVNANYFDLHILCTPDIPWEYDPQREHPEQRDELFQLYRKELIASKKNFIEVSGSREERLKKSLEAIATIQS